MTPDRIGPYDADANGRCANGHPLNGYGRCEPLNTTGVCQQAAPASGSEQ